MSDEQRLHVFETAVLTIIKAMQEYLPPDSGVSKEQFIDQVIGAVDNEDMFRALEGKK